MKRVFLLALPLLVLVSGVNGQNVMIQLGPDEIGQNQPFTITITVENEQIKSYSPFPDIEGFYKRGTSSSSSTNIINGRVSSRQSITQNYLAEREGTYPIPPFSMTINGRTANSPGKTVRVGPPVQSRRNDPFFSDPFEDFFGEREESLEFLDIKDNAFLALISDKEDVYVGEGFTITLSFYVADDNKAPLQFFDPAAQLSEIIKDLKPANCWEENFNIENLTGEPVTINGKSYSQYKIFQAAYYPLNPDTIRFPQIPFKMIKYKVAKNPSFFGRNRMEDFKTYYTQPKTILVKQLPPHPLRESVSVGKFRLKENMETQQLETGKSFNYIFTIEGEGNIASVNKPLVRESSLFEIYPPNIRQNINRSGTRVVGSKAFNFYLIPNEPGEYNLGDFFSWVYFDPDKGDYDTLTSEMLVHVYGESKRNNQIIARDVGTFYDQIEIEENKLFRLGGNRLIKFIGNTFIIIMLGMAAYYIFKK